MRQADADGRLVSGAIWPIYRHSLPSGSGRRSTRCSRHLTMRRTAISTAGNLRSLDGRSLARRHAARRTMACPSPLRGARQRNHGSGRREPIISTPAANQPARRHVRRPFAAGRVRRSARSFPAGVPNQRPRRAIRPRRSRVLLRPADSRVGRRATEVRYRDEIVKRYRVPAPNQELILAAFEEEGWPQLIDDPLPPQDELNPSPAASDD